MNEEAEKVERTKMRYPKGRMVVVRDSTIATCNNNNPGAVLLSVLLFWYDNPHTCDSYDDKEQTFTICRTQAEIEAQACHQIDVKTIHRTAVPLLQLFGYLTVSEKMNGNLYILHMDRIFAAYAAYEKSAEALKNFLKSSLQLDICPIEIPESQIDKILINKTNVQLQLDKILIANRQMSNCKRGRKPKSERGLEAISEETENLRESYENNSNERESEHEQSNTSPIASALSLDAAPSFDNETHSQLSITDSTTPLEGDTDHALPVPAVQPPSLLDHNEPTAPTGAGQMALLGPAGLSDGVPVVAVVAFAASGPATGGSAEPDTTAGDEQFPHVGDMISDGAPQDHAPAAVSLTPLPPPVASITERRSVVVVGPLSAVPSTDEGATVAVEVSHPQDRDTSHTSGAVEDGPGLTLTPTREAAGSTSPQMRVLIVKQQFTSVDEWKAAQSTFTLTLRGVWKGSNAADKKRYGTFNAYRKQHLDRWLEVNPDPSIARFTPEGRVLFDEWCSLFKVSVDAGKANIEAANWLAGRLTTWAGLLGMTRPEVMRDFKGWCYTNDKNGYYKRGVKLFDLKRDFEGWQSYQQSLLDKRERDRPARTLTKEELRRMPV